MKLAIFDLDGVLVDTHTIHTEALRTAVCRIVSPEAASATYLDASDGLRTKHKLKRLKADFNLTDEILYNIDLLKKVITIEKLSKIQPNEMIVSEFEKLKANGYYIAIASNSRRAYVDIIASHLGICRLLDYILCGDEVVKSKPDPEIFKKIMRLFYAKPETTFIFEDSDAGLQAARQTGASVIQIDPTKLIGSEDFKCCK